MKAHLLYPLKTIHGEKERHESMSLKGNKGQGTADGRHTE